MGSATSLPAMMNLGLGQKVEGSQEKANECGCENNKEREVKTEGRGVYGLYTAHLLINYNVELQKVKTSFSRHAILHPSA